MNERLSDSGLHATGDFARAARNLIRQAMRAALGTLLPNHAPFVSMVVPAADVDCSPLVLLSDLAQHTRNLAGDARASLLFEGEAPSNDPSATVRLTLTGTLSRLAKAGADRRYRAFYPHSALGVLGGFYLYRFEIDRVFFIGGFAQARRMEAAALLLPAPAIEVAHDELVDWVHAIHSDRLELTRNGAIIPARVVGIDAEGLDIAAEGQRGRLQFPKAVDAADAFKAAVTALLTPGLSPGENPNRK